MPFTLALRFPLFACKAPKSYTCSTSFLSVGISTESRLIVDMSVDRLSTNTTTNYRPMCRMLHRQTQPKVHMIQENYDGHGNGIVAK